MGRNNKKYFKTLHQQAHERLENMLSPGESKHAAKGTDEMKDKIYSYNTYKTYKQHVNYFTSWMHKNHPEVTSLKKAKKYVPEWLEARAGQTNSRGELLSAWTLQTEAAALNKLFGIDKADPERFQAPHRHRVDIKRSRGDVAMDRHFSVKNNDELIKFCQGTGCRRNVLTKLKGDDYWPRERMQKEVVRLETLLKEKKLDAREETLLKNMKKALATFPMETDFVHHIRDKGGRSRFAPIIGEHKQQIIERFRKTEPSCKVWLHVNTKADIHSYRSVYITELYRMYARNIDTIAYDKVNRGTGRRYQSEVYNCKADERGKKLDKKAMQVASYAAGHNRISVIANNYLRNL